MNVSVFNSSNRRKFFQVSSLLTLAAFSSLTTTADAAPDNLQKGRPQVLKFSPGVLGGSASANGWVKIKDGTVSGVINARKLPALLPGEFFIAWYTNLETGNAVFLGSLVNNNSIIFSSEGLSGRLNFKPSAYTVHLPIPGTEEHTTSEPIAAAAIGKNQIVVLIEKSINGMTPAPLFPPASFPPGPVESLVLGVTF
jgi:hypothetical protein